ncbi:uracil-DNA glycosylase, partial [Rubrivivax gelatinosus]|nr:uracil-DNA glycosylase [Rubrivivax gelatinosus]
MVWSERQVAMLRTIGVRLWQPAADAPAEAETADEPAPAEPATNLRREPLPVAAAAPAAAEAPAAAARVQPARTEAAPAV